MVDSVPYTTLHFRSLLFHQTNVSLLYIYPALCSLFPVLPLTLIPIPPTAVIQTKPASAKSRSNTRTATRRPRNSVWSSLTCSAAPSSPSSRRTSALPRKCRSPSPSSSAWSSAPSATSSWTRGAAAWIAGTTTTVAAPGSRARPPPPSPRPERRGGASGWPGEPGWSNRRRGEAVPKPGGYSHAGLARTIWTCPLPEEKKEILLCHAIIFNVRISGAHPKEA